jgi:type II secretory pathway pseudopilin PulG
MMLIRHPTNASDSEGRGLQSVRTLTSSSAPTGVAGALGGGVLISSHPGCRIGRGAAKPSIVTFRRMRVQGSHRTTRTFDEDGFTLVELGISMLIMGFVLALFVPTLIVLLKGESNVGALSDANTQIQPALELLQNQVNSASVLYDPVIAQSSQNAAVQSGFAVLIFTYGADDSLVCSQWRVIHTYTSDHRRTQTVLQNRTWNPTSPTATAPLAFRTIGADLNVVNPRTARGHMKPPFQLGGSSPPLSNELVVTLWLSPSARLASKIQIRTVDAKQGVDLLTPNRTQNKCKTPGPPPVTSKTHLTTTHPRTP